MKTHIPYDLVKAPETPLSMSVDVCVHLGHAECQMEFISSREPVNSR